MTSQQTVDGVLQNEDSRLVKADKTPAHMTCVLKNLVDTGNRRLSNGRQIVSNVNTPKDDSITIFHPDFRMIVLANRPVFPFLRNDLFSTLGKYLLIII